MAGDEDRLNQARELLLRKQYDQARAILRDMPNNATAIQWLIKLNQIAPAPPQLSVQEQAVRAQLIKARELIQARQFDAARAILKRLPANKTAQDWLARLDRLDQPSPPSLPEFPSSDE